MEVGEIVKLASVGASERSIDTISFRTLPHDAETNGLKLANASQSAASQRPARSERAIPGPAGSVSSYHSNVGASPVEAQSTFSVGQHESIVREGRLIKLPIRKRPRPMNPDDADFQSHAWKTMLRELDLVPFQAEGPGSTQVTSKSPFVRHTLSFIAKEGYKNKVPQLIVFVKSVQVQVAPLFLMSADQRFRCVCNLEGPNRRNGRNYSSKCDGRLRSRHPTRLRSGAAQSVCP